MFNAEAYALQHLWVLILVRDLQSRCSELYQFYFLCRGCLCRIALVVTGRCAHPHSLYTYLEPV